MPPSDAENGRSRKRPPLNRRRFLRRSLTAGTFGLPALFGLTDGGGRRTQATSKRSREFPPSSRELAG